MRNTSGAWLSYFRLNAHNDPPPIGASAATMEPALRTALVRSLGRFYLGETGEGRIAHEAARSGDGALDEAMCESIALYVREEGRHARALAGAVIALGAPLPTRHYSEALFRRARRLMGLRTKMLTIAVAEIVGLAYYQLLAERVPALADLALALARDEREHLAFQAEYFARVVERGGSDPWPRARAATIALGYAAITSCATATLALDHGPLLRALRVTRTDLALRCAREAWRGLGACRELLREGRPLKPSMDIGAVAQASFPSTAGGSEAHRPWARNANARAASEHPHPRT